MNNQDKLTMKHFYYIKCDPDLGKGFCAMRRITCACTGFVEQLTKPWLPNLDKTLKPCYAIKPKTCRYSSNDRGSSGLTTVPMNWKQQQSVNFPCFRFANSNTISFLSCRCLVLVLFSSYSFFFFSLQERLSVLQSCGILFNQVYT